MRKLALYGVAAVMVAIVTLPAPGQGAGVTFTGVVKVSTVKARKAAIRIVPATGQQREADIGTRLDAIPAVRAEIERQGYDVANVVVMRRDADGSVTVYVLAAD